MSVFAENLVQEATYWEPGVPDGFGGLDFSAVIPVVIAVRWEDRAVLFRDAQAREVVSEAIVYSSVAVENRGYLALGDIISTGMSSDPRELGGKEIRNVLRSPSLDAGEMLYKVML